MSSSEKLNIFIQFGVFSQALLLNVITAIDLDIKKWIIILAKQDYFGPSTQVSMHDFMRINKSKVEVGRIVGIANDRILILHVN